MVCDWAIDEYFNNKTNLPLLCPMEYSEPIRDMHCLDDNVHLLCR